MTIARAVMARIVRPMWLAERITSGTSVGRYRPLKGHAARRSSGGHRRRCQSLQHLGGRQRAETAIDDPVLLGLAAALDDQIGAVPPVLAEPEGDVLALGQRPGARQVEALDEPAQGLAGD